MAKIEYHCAESVKLWGRAHTEVHRWLDEFAGSSEYGMRHRKKRHHLAGIDEAARLFGDEVRPVARQHVVTDLKEEGWTERDHFPIDENDYVKMGLF